MTANELTSLVDKVLGGAHELLFSARLRSKGYSHDFSAHTSKLDEPECAAAAVICEANSMLCSTAFVDVLASVASGVAKVYADVLGNTIHDHIPRDGACAVDKAQVEAVITGLAKVEISVLDDQAEATAVMEGKTSWRGERECVQRQCCGTKVSARAPGRHVEREWRGVDRKALWNRTRNAEEKDHEHIF